MNIPKPEKPMPKIPVRPPPNKYGKKRKRANRGLKPTKKSKYHNMTERQKQDTALDLMSRAVTNQLELKRDICQITRNQVYIDTKVNTLISILELDNNVALKGIKEEVKEIDENGEPDNQTEVEGKEVSVVAVVEKDVKRVAVGTKTNDNIKSHPNAKVNDVGAKSPEDS